jgi:hypothetical protein
MSSEMPFAFRVSDQAIFIVTAVSNTVRFRARHISAIFTRTVQLIRVASVTLNLVHGTENYVLKRETKTG